MTEMPQPCHNLALNLEGRLIVMCGVVVAYAPRCAYLSPNGLECEATTTCRRNRYIYDKSGRSCYRCSVDQNYYSWGADTLRKGATSTLGGADLRKRASRPIPLFIVLMALKVG